jgi:hypothetical protein
MFSAALQLVGELHFEVGHVFVFMEFMIQEAAPPHGQIEIQFTAEFM